MTRSNLLIAAALIVSTGAFTSAAHAASEIGDNSTFSMTGKVNSQIAVATGIGASAASSVGSVHVVGDFKVGKKVQMTANGKANSQIAVATGIGATATNSVGSFMVIGTR